MLADWALGSEAGSAFSLDGQVGQGWDRAFIKGRVTGMPGQGSTLNDRLSSLVQGAWFKAGSVAITMT